MSPVAWVLNLDAEDELSHEGAHTPTAAMTARIESLIPRLTDLIRPGDQIVWPGDQKFNGLPGRAWCPTPWALHRLERAQAVPPRAPSIEILQRVNHRRFSHQLGQTLPGAGYAENRDELERLLATRPGEWLIKRAYGYAGRGRRKVRAAELTAADQSWLEASWRTREGLQVEPFMQLELDCALHGWLAEDGACTFGQPTTQEVDANGAWQSTRLATELTGNEFESLAQEAQRTAAALHRAGYFGPFGIDGFRFEGGAFQPRSEINARYSMGWAIGMSGSRPPSS